MEIEIPFGAFDSELMHQEINIPEGFEATIEGNKIILTRTEIVDDEIRKELLRIVKENKGSIYISLAPRIKSFLISLLEKKGGQNDSDVKDYNSIDPHFGKPNDKVEPKFKVGDWDVWDNKISCHIDNIYQGKESLMYTITDNHNMTRSYSVKGFDNNAHLWTINDARDGDVLVDKWGNIGIYQGDTNAITWHSCCYCGVNKMFYDGGRHEFPCYPATKEQRDLLFQKMKEAGYEWDSEKKELKKIVDKKQIKKNLQDNSFRRMFEQKSAEWSEDDEQYLLVCKNALSKYQVTDKWDSSIISQWLDNKLGSFKDRAFQQQQEWSEEDKKKIQSLIEHFEYKNEFTEAEDYDIVLWLKSLKQRYTWKPSKEQMIALDSTLQYSQVSNNSYEHLNSLYNDLKKLTE